jgi:hypothetical protein
VSACESNRNLRSVLIHGSVLLIENRAFSDCVSLSVVDFVLPSNVASIREAAFRGCKSRTEFRLFGSARDLAVGFVQGSGIRQVSVDGDNPRFKTMRPFLMGRAPNFGVYVRGGAIPGQHARARQLSYHDNCLQMFHGLARRPDRLAFSVQITSGVPVSTVNR